MTYLIYEGPDLVGKTTTRKLVEKQRDGKDVVIDRFIGSNIVYGILNNRYTEEEIKSLHDDEFKFSATFRPVLIYLYAPLEEILKRIKQDSHIEIDSEKIKKTIEEFEKYYEQSQYKNKIKIDTSKFNKEEVASQILEYLKHIETT